MAESYPADATLNALSGTTDTPTGAAYPTIGEAPYYTAMYKMLRQILTAIGPTIANLQPYVDDGGDHTLGVRSGTVNNGDGTIGTFAGGTIALENGETNYVYLALVSGAWTITKDTTSYPADADYFPIATVDLSGTPAALLSSHITDTRAAAMFNLIAAGA
jgi:hypothetical protein